MNAYEIAVIRVYGIAVFDLHKAMSLGSDESAALKSTVQAFNSATTRTAQYALMDQLMCAA